MRRLVFLLLVTAIACADSEAPTPTAPTQSPTVKYWSVEYRVTNSASGSTTLGTPRVSLTFENSSGGTSQYGSVVPPWSYPFGAATGTFVYVSAQNGSGELVLGNYLFPGITTVEIMLDGRRWKSSIAASAFSIATVSGSLPARGEF